MDLDRDTVPHNTPAARAALVNAPAWTEGLSLKTHPRVPPRLLARTGLGESVILYGPVGTGKTGLGVCLLRERAATGEGSTFLWNMVTGPGLAAVVDAGEVARGPSPCWFESWPRLVAAQRRARWDEEEWFDVLDERVSVLMLDDVSVDAGTPFRESLLLRHLDWASTARGRSLVLTMNAAPKTWRQVFGERVADRMVDPRRFSIVHVEGGSLR